MTKPHHPIRDVEIHVYQRIGSDNEFIGRFYPYDVYPIFFTADSPEAVITKAEVFRTETLQKYEAQYISRLNNLKIAQERKEKSGKGRKKKSAT